MDREAFIDFQGRRVVVTGATSGIGEAVVEELLACGARPIVVGRNRDKLDRLMTRLGLPSGSALELDLGNLPEIAPAALALAEKTGRIYGFCHAAGLVETRPFSSVSVESLRKMLDVNLLSGLEMARALCRRDVMETDGGSVLFISSIYALIGMPGEIGYSASKGALIAAARTMAVELARRGIRVNTISPGFVRTAMTEQAFKRLSDEHRARIVEAHPLGPGRPGDVARAVAFLLAPQNTWITGANLVIDGGYTAR